MDLTIEQVMCEAVVAVTRPTSSSTVSGSASVLVCSTAAGSRTAELGSFIDWHLISPHLVEESIDLLPIVSKGPTLGIGPLDGLVSLSWRVHAEYRF